MYLLPKNQSLRLAAALAEDHEIYGPVLDPLSGEPLFGKAVDPALIRLDAAIPYNPPKSAVFPQSERILSYRYDRTSRQVDLVRDDHVRPKALVGLRACDLTGILCLDRFYLGQEYVDEVYRDHRKKLFIVANTCVRPFPQCFCVCTDSGPAAREGFDVNLTEAGDSYLFETGSDRGRRPGPPARVEGGRPGRGRPQEEDRRRLDRPVRRRGHSEQGLDLPRHEPGDDGFRQQRRLGVHRRPVLRVRGLLVRLSDLLLFQHRGRRRPGGEDRPAEVLGLLLL